MTELASRLTVSPAEAAGLLGLSRQTFYTIMHRADFTAAFKIGQRTLVSVAGLREWIAQQTGGKTE